MSAYITRTNTGADDGRVYVCRDPETGLRAFIAIDDERRLPGVGGCRMWPYRSEADAICDARRLARGMSYKSALADLPFGGAKSVILGDPKCSKSETLLRAFGRFVDGLGGRYVVAEDVGISVGDVEVMGRETRHTAGRSRAAGSSGDPSPLTAYGVFVGMRASLAHQQGCEDLHGVGVAVQGLGHVGWELAVLLHEAGARLVVTDLDCERALRAARELGAAVVEPDRILEQDVLVVAPCALGQVLNDDSIPLLRARIVAGAANNQLAADHHGAALAERGILYAPDYVINAGGIINVASELRGAYDPAWTRTRIEGIRDRLLSVFRESDATGVPPHQVADAQARRKLAAPRAA